MSNGLNIVYLRTTTFLGSIGAEHYYGKLEAGWEEYDSRKDSSIELKHKLTRKEAAYLNKKSGYSYSLYKPGEMSERFDSEEQLFALAKKIWKDKFPDGVVLICGSSGTCQPQKPLDALDLVLLKKLEKVWVKFEPMWNDGCNGWDKHTDKMQKLCDEWYSLLKQKWN